MKPQSYIAVGCVFALCCANIPQASSQGTGKVQEFFKKYFGEYFPKTTRSYTLYGNALNGPADFNAGLPVAEDHEGTINSIIIRRGSPGRNQQNQGPNAGQPLHQANPMNNPNAWQPMQNFAPVGNNPGGHRGRSDLPEDMLMDDTVAQPMQQYADEETRIITADDLLPRDDDIREIQMESSMSFAPGTVN